MRFGEQHWMDEAACRGEAAELFFPVEEAGTAAPKAICRACPVRSQCLDFAMATRQEFGVWGGLGQRERERLRRRRRDQERRAERVARIVSGWSA